MNSDVIIIGAGPGGYETAIYAAKKGLSVTLFEQRKAGGTCLHEGCIPTKCLCRSAEIADTISDCDTWGFHVSAPTIDFQRIMERKNEVVAQLTSGIEFLLKHKLITYIPERAELFDAHTVISESGEKYTRRTHFDRNARHRPYPPKTVYHWSRSHRARIRLYLP